MTKEQRAKWMRVCAEARKASNNALRDRIRVDNIQTIAERIIERFPESTERMEQLVSDAIELKIPADAFATDLYFRIHPVRRRRSDPFAN